MTSQTDGTPTPDKVADLATETAQFASTSLIGTFGTPAAPGALLRLRNGDILRVVPGDKVGGSEVIAIGPDTVALARNGTSTLLHLPGS